MPRYFFHVHDGKNIKDVEGVVLPDCQSARVEAVRLSGAILKDEARTIASGGDWHIEVTDESGLILFQMTFLMIDAPAVERLL